MRQVRYIIIFFSYIITLMYVLNSYFINKTFYIHPVDNLVVKYERSWS